MDATPVPEVVMTPLKGPDKETKIIKIERYPYKKLDKNKVQHIAGGPYKGIIVHKAMTGGYEVWDFVKQLISNSDSS